MDKKIIIDKKELEIIIDRLCHQLIEFHDDFSNSVIMVLQPRGVFLARKIIDKLSKILSLKDKIKYGELDSTFFRDDFRRKKTSFKT